MERLKPFSELLTFDPRNSLFVRLETFEPSTIEEHYAEIAFAALDSQVPEEIRSYFATIQNVCLYAWFAYDLFAMVDFLCSTAFEMALRKKLPFSGTGEDKRGLQGLMDEATKKNLIRDKAFSRVREARQKLADDIRFQRSIGRDS